MRHLNWLTTGLVFLICLSSMPSWSQERPQGRFLQDSIKIGEPAAYAIVFRHHNQEVVFPDSNYNFYPFDFIKKEFFPTRVVGNFIIDSAVYYLTTFEVDSVLPLGLPVFVLENGDSTALFAIRDTILLSRLVEAVPDSIALKENTAFQEVNTRINYPYIAIGVGVFLWISAIVVGIFGKKIRKKFILYKLKKEHKRFIDRVNILMSLMNGNPNHQAGLIVLEWKKYLETLEKHPFTKLTTKEIVRMYPDRTLEHTLKSLDRSLYGNIEDAHMKDLIHHLMDYSFVRYKKRVEEVKHAI